MVDLLWRRGNASGAILLEEQWNDLGKSHDLSLLCAYAIGTFHQQAHADSFRRICWTHKHVRPAETYPATDDSESRLREVALLQQRARALESEIQHRETLETALRDALRERERSERAAQEADRRKDEFLAMLGHELRNPLAPILTAVQLMQLRSTGGDREILVIERQVRHLVRLVDDLLDVSRITRGKVELKKEPVELASVVAKAIEMASPLFEQRSHSLDVDVPRDGMLLEADPVRLGQVLANLLTNAAKYTDPGGHVVVKAWRESDAVFVSVKDDGVGISEEMLPNVFELFVQGHRTIDRSQGGLGIGLTLARSLVELHGGAIEAKSDGPGKGTEFVVRLTSIAGASHDPPLRKPQKLGIVRSSGVRLLLVDDNVDAADILADSLRTFGHEIAIAHDGPEALRVARNFEPDTAILDIGLPVMDGYELAVKLREQMAARPPRLIALTGYGQEADKARSVEAGFDVHLVKPVNLSTIVAFLNEKAEATSTRTRIRAVRRASKQMP
jgi:signal transduction histidine kinase/ActR/RegA family two-component response regulator